MKNYIVRYTYNHGWIETYMIVKAESPEAAAEEAFSRSGVERIVSVKESPENNEKSAKDFCDAIRMFAEKPENLQNLECYLSRHFREWMKKYANDPENIAAELKEFANMAMS